MPELAPSLVTTPSGAAAVAGPVWTASEEKVRGSNLARFVDDLRGRVPAPADPDAREHERLHARSVTNTGARATPGALAHFRDRPELCA